MIIKQIKDVPLFSSLNGSEKIPTGGRGVFTTTVDQIKNYTIGSFSSLLDNKVDKIAGKTLSSNDFTTAEKTKLASISSGANSVTLLKNLQDVSDVAPVTGQALIFNGTIWSPTAVTTNLTPYMLKSTYDSNTNGVVNDSEKLGNNLPSYYTNRTNHTGTQSVTTLSDFTTSTDSRINLKIQDQITNGVTTIAPSQNAVFDALQAKQATLISGTNIKTINGTSLLGSGNITLNTGTTTTSQDILTTTLTGLSTLLEGDIKNTDTILQAFGRLQNQISAGLTKYVVTGSVIDKAITGKYPFQLSDGTLHTQVTTLVTMPSGYYIFTLCGAPGFSPQDVSVIVTETAEVVASLSVDEIVNFTSFRSTGKPIQANQLQNNLKGAKGWTDNLNSPTSCALYYLFQGANDLNKGPQPSASYLAIYPDAIGGNSGNVGVTNIIHFAEPTEIQIKIPAPNLDPSRFDSSTFGTGFVWIRTIPVTPNP